MSISNLFRLAGARPPPEHPHAIVEDMAAKRNVQECAIEIEDHIATFDYKVELESI